MSSAKRPSLPSLIFGWLLQLQSPTAPTRIERKEMIRVMHDEHGFQTSSLHFCWPEVCGRKPISWHLLDHKLSVASNLT